MGTTTFNGTVRSETGFSFITKDATTGAVTEGSKIDSSGVTVASGDALTVTGGPTIDSSGVTLAPVALADGDTTLTAATNGNRINIVPDGGQDNTLTLPSPTAGMHFTFVYGGGAADATDFIIDTGADANFFIGGVTHFDTDADSAGDEIVSVYSDGDSNSKLQVNVPAACEIHVLGLDTTNWQIWGNVVSATAPAFSDQA